LEAFRAMPTVLFGSSRQANQGAPLHWRRTSLREVLGEGDSFLLLFFWKRVAMRRMS
jgi:hypothetical protein